MLRRSKTVVTHESTSDTVRTEEKFWRQSFTLKNNVKEQETFREILSEMLALPCVVFKTKKTERNTNCQDFNDKMQYERPEKILRWLNMGIKTNNKSFLSKHIRKRKGAKECLGSINEESTKGKFKEIKTVRQNTVILPYKSLVPAAW